MPGRPGRREPHEGSAYIGTVVGRQASDVRRLRRLSQEEVADRMQRLGHASWIRQTIGQVEKGDRSITVDEVVSLAAALGTSLSFLLSPSPPWDAAEPSDRRVDIGGPVAFTEGMLAALYGFKPETSPTPQGFYDWPEMVFQHGTLTIGGES